MGHGGVGGPQLGVAQGEFGVVWHKGRGPLEFEAWHQYQYPESAEVEFVGVVWFRGGNGPVEVLVDGGGAGGFCAFGAGAGGGLLPHFKCFKEEGELVAGEATAFVGVGEAVVSNGEDHVGSVAREGGGGGRDGG